MAGSQKSSRESGRRRTGKAPAQTRQTARSRKSKPSFLRALLELLRLSWLGRVLLVCLITAAVLGINILVSANQYDLFFILTGIELVVTALFFWLRLVLRRT